MIIEDTVRQLAPVPDQLWPEAEQDAALGALLQRIGVEAGDPTALRDEAEFVPAPGRRRWSWGAAVAAAIVVLLVGVGAVLVALHRSSAHDGVGPAASTSPSAASSFPEVPIEIPIDHDGAYHYMSAPVDSTLLLAVILPVDATFADPPHVRSEPAPDGRHVVIVVDFQVTSHQPGSHLEIARADGGVVSQVGPACRQSSGGCADATKPGNVRPS